MFKHAVAAKAEFANHIREFNTTHENEVRTGLDGPFHLHSVNTPQAKPQAAHTAGPERSRFISAAGQPGVVASGRARSARGGPWSRPSPGVCLRCRRCWRLGRLRRLPRRRLSCDRCEAVRARPRPTDRRNQPPPRATTAASNDRREPDSREPENTPGGRCKPACPRAWRTKLRLSPPRGSLRLCRTPLILTSILTKNIVEAQSRLTE